MKKHLFTAGLALGLAFAFGTAHAEMDLNEVGAFLVYPGAAAFVSGGTNIETFLTITNTSSASIIAHVSFINGNELDPRYCYECDFDVPMTGLDTETLVLTRNGNQTDIVNLDSGARRSCSQFIGFVTVDVEDAAHNVLTDNILLGSEVVVDYTGGSALSVPAISIQGETGNGDRFFAFDGVEYRKFPSVVGADFLAPDANHGLVDAALILFTLAFERQVPPFTDCSVIGYDAFEDQFSNSFTFGCWTLARLEDIDPEFAYPNLGGQAGDYQEHGWVQLSCTVQGTGASNGIIAGGVHGMIAQYVAQNAQLRRGLAHPGPVMTDAAAWARILFQSRTVGDALTLHLEAPGTGGGF